MDRIDTIISQLEQRKEAIDKALAALRGIETDTTPTGTAGQRTTAVRPGRRFTAATRRRMAIAQRRRYAALRGETIAEDPETSARAAKPTTPQRRKVSAQGLANIRAAVKRRWAMRRKATATAAKKVATKKGSAPAEKSGGE